jgi:hypothetical protein
MEIRGSFSAPQGAGNDQRIEIRPSRSRQINAAPGTRFHPARLGWLAFPRIRAKRSGAPLRSAELEELRRQVFDALQDVFGLADKMVVPLPKIGI